MFTASLQLCKELHDLSGWEEKFAGIVPYWLDDGDGGEWVCYDNYGDDVICPAYDLGYLLRRLPTTSALIRIEPTMDGKWRACDRRTFCHADTPEDAVCALAIELFKAGILNKSV
jgi:hypothetical protein